MNNFRKTPAHWESGSAWWIVCLAIFVLVAGLAALVVEGTKRAVSAAVTQPAPEAVRARAEAIDKEIEKKAEEVRNAPMEQKIDRARSLREFGRMRDE